MCSEGSSTFLRPVWLFIQTRFSEEMCMCEEWAQHLQLALHLKFPPSCVWGQPSLSHEKEGNYSNKQFNLAVANNIWQVNSLQRKHTDGLRFRPSTFKRVTNRKWTLDWPVWACASMKTLRSSGYRLCSFVTHNPQCWPLHASWTEERDMWRQEGETDTSKRE